jgi:hypothetical protein
MPDSSPSDATVHLLCLRAVPTRYELLAFSEAAEHWELLSLPIERFARVIERARSGAA